MLLLIANLFGFIRCRFVCVILIDVLFKLFWSSFVYTLTTLISKPFFHLKEEMLKLRRTRSLTRVREPEFETYSTISEYVSRLYLSFIFTYPVCNEIHYLLHGKNNVFFASDLKLTNK